MCKHSYHFLSTQECTRTFNRQIKSQSAKDLHHNILSHTHLTQFPIKCIDLLQTTAFLWQTTHINLWKWTGLVTST